MTPDIELQLQTVIKSLKDNVAPAIEPGNQLAAEQMHLSLATLEIVLDHLPLAHRVVRRDLQDHLEMANSLRKHCLNEADHETLGDAVAAGAAAIEDPSLGFTQLQQGAREIRDAIGIAIANYSGHDNTDAMEAIVLKHADTNLELGRAWNKPMGFEPNPDAVTNIEVQL